MTNFDTIFNAAAEAAGLSWVFVYENTDRTLKVDSEVRDYPCILRGFRETVQPLFNARQQWERTMNLYIIHAGFRNDTAEQINENLEEIMSAFIVWRESMRRSGVEVTLNSRPFPNWEQTNLDEYGYVFELTCKYTVCQS